MTNQSIVRLGHALRSTLLHNQKCRRSNETMFPLPLSTPTCPSTFIDLSIDNTIVISGLAPSDTIKGPSDEHGRCNVHLFISYLWYL